MAYSSCVLLHASMKRSSCLEVDLYPLSSVRLDGPGRVVPAREEFCVNVSMDSCLSFAAPCDVLETDAVFALALCIDEEDDEPAPDLPSSLLTRAEAAFAARMDRIDFGIPAVAPLPASVRAVPGGAGIGRDTGDASAPAGLDEMTIASKLPASS